MAAMTNIERSSPRIHAITPVSAAAAIGRRNTPTNTWPEGRTRLIPTRGNTHQSTASTIRSPTVSHPRSVCGSERTFLHIGGGVCEQSFATSSLKGLCVVQVDGACFESSWHDTYCTTCWSRLINCGLFTGVRGIGILRTSPFGDSPKFSIDAQVGEVRLRPTFCAPLAP